MPFQPHVHDELIINGLPYRISEHPAAPGMPHGQEGRAGIVYCLEALGPSPTATQGLAPKAALKVFKPRFRTPALVSQAERFAVYADLPGLIACRRVVLIPSRHAELLHRYPDLTYAVLMPWIEGPTWQEMLLEKRFLSPERTLALAQGLTSALARLEQQGLAHCDLSAPNVLLPALAQSPVPNPQSPIELVDLEGLYVSGFTRPQEVSSGSLGYAHRQAAGGLWGPEADRFAGAVLMAEMLGWCDPQVVQAAWGESYFDPDEMQRECDRYRLLVDSLRSYWGEETANMFERAWRSETLADCPTFGEWLVALQERVAGTLSGPTPKKEVTPLAQGPVEAAKRSPADGAPSAQPEPIPKSQSLEELRSQAYSFTTQGQWKEVVNICGMILSRWPDQGDIALLLFRARRLVDMDQEVEQAWLKAMQSGQPEDWETCLKAAQTILQQSPQTARYQEIVERAHQELEWAAIVTRAEALVADNRREEALVLLDVVPADHTLAARVRAQLEIARSREWRVAELLRRAEAQIRQDAWEDAIVTCQMGLALSSSTTAFHILFEQAYREREIERKVAEHRAAADRAAQAMDWEKAVVSLEAALALRPQRAELQARHEQFTQYRTWASRLVEARQLLTAYAWEDAQMKLAGIPDEFMQTAALREQVQRERDRKERLDAARAAYDGEGALALLADVGPDYPGLAGWQAWAQSWVERRRLLAQAQHERRWQDASQLLREMPPDYPDRERLLQEAEHLLWQQQNLERVQADLAACRWQEVITGCEQIIAEGGDPALFSPLRERARQELMTDEEAARLAHQAEERVQSGALLEAVVLLGQALVLRPDRRDLSRRLAEVRRAWEREQAIEQAQQAFAEERWDDVLRLVKGWVAEDVCAADLYQNARNRLVAELYEQAETSEREERWDVALTALKRLQALSVTDEGLSARVERAQHEFEAAQALDRGRQAYGRGRWKEVLAEANRALALFPNRTEALALRQEAEQALALQRQRRQRLIIGLSGALAVLILLVWLSSRCRGPSDGGHLTPAAQAGATASIPAIAMTHTTILATQTATTSAEFDNVTAGGTVGTSTPTNTSDARLAVIPPMDTPTPPPTDTPMPPPTDTPTPPPTDTPKPPPTDTPTPPPTDTPTPPPTDTPTPPPTDTPKPTNTPNDTPKPTDTPPAATSTPAAPVKLLEPAK